MASLESIEMKSRQKSPEIAIKYTCEICDYNCCNQIDINNHKTATKHIFREHFESYLSPKVTKLSCEYCKYNCKKQSDLDKHLATTKHKLNTNNLKLTDTYFCNVCKHSFKSYSGLWHHKKKYHSQDKKEHGEHGYGEHGYGEHEYGEHEYGEKDIKGEPSLATMFLEMMKQNEEFKQLLIEQNKQNQELQKQVVEIASTANNNITNNTCISNTTNNKFNLTLFLNETCKDAMNIQEFIDYVTVQHSDFENFGKMGYVEALTRIFLRNLMELEVHRRPIHCSDLKREVLYVKDNNVWVSDVTREKLIRTIKYIANKNVKQIPGWMDKNPDSKNTQTKLHDKYMRMLCFSMGAKTEEEDQEYYKKIIRNVAKEVCIDKTR